MNDITKFMNGITKLPKWAQRYISTLERETREAKDHARAVLDNQTPSNIVVDPYGDTIKYVQTDRLYFKIKDGMLYVKLWEDHIEICAVGSLADRIAVTPSYSSNTIRVYLTNL